MTTGGSVGQRLGGTDRPAGVRPRLAAIVLAGGRSIRFGPDKLAAPFRGRPLLWHALRAVAGLADESILVLAHDARLPDLPPADPDPSVVRDPLPDEGPLVGLLTGLRSTSAEVAVVIGGDMPLVRADVLRLLVDRVTSGEHVAAVLLDAGRRRPLPAALRVGPARTTAGRLVDAGERSLRSLAAALDAAAVEEAAWRALDPDGSSLRDVDTPEDLSALAGGRRPSTADA
jgi:molybdenum cofactor guanylyltransferase